MTRVLFAMALIVAALINSKATADPTPATVLSAPHSIMFRVGQFPSDALFSEIERVAKPITLAVRANQIPEDALRDNCGGTVTQAYLRRSSVMNKTFAWGVATSEPRQLQVLPCPRFNRNDTVVTTLPGEGLDGLLRRVSGVGKGGKINICKMQEDAPECYVTGGAMTAALAANAGLDLNALEQLPAGTQVTVPFTTAPTEIPIKEDLDLDAAADQLRRAAPTSAPRYAQRAPPLDLLHPLKASDALVKGTSCSPDAPIDKNIWPFDSERLHQALVRAVRLARDIKPTGVRIADTGAAGLETVFFPQTILTIDPAVSVGTTVDEDNHGRYGIDAAGEGDVSPYDDDPEKFHGTEVADLALGGLAYRTRYDDITGLIRLSFAKIYRHSDKEIISDQTTLSNSLMLESLEASIVNVSVAGKRSLFNFSTTLRNAPAGTFVVMAAGNVPEGYAGTLPLSLDANRLYPAWLGGLNGAFVDSTMVVGASAPDGSIAPFSYVGKEHVDILAPGCRLTLSFPSGTSDDIGTSFSAPLVTFAAAMVRALGVRTTIQLKRHLIASGDFDPSQLEQTIWGMRLNIVRAISTVFDTIVVDQAGYDHYWKWQATEDVNFCADTSYKSREIYRVDPFVGADGSEQLRLLREDGSNKSHFKVTICKANAVPVLVPIDPATGEVAAGPAAGPTSWQDIKAFIPAQIRAL